MNDTGDNTYDHYRDNPFGVLESPPLTFDEGAVDGHAVDAVAGGTTGTDETQLELDSASVARVGPDALVRLGAAPVRLPDGSLEIVVAEMDGERIAAVREHFATEVPLTVVSASTLDRLLADARGPAEVANGATHHPDESFARILGLFDEEADRFQTLRQKLQGVGRQIEERDRRLQQLEGDLGRLRIEREHDRGVIERLRNDVAERDGRLDRAAAKADELIRITREGGTL